MSNTQRGIVRYFNRAEALLYVAGDFPLGFDIESMTRSEPDWLWVEPGTFRIIGREEFDLLSLDADGIFPAYQIEITEDEAAHAERYGRTHIAGAIRAAL